MLMRSMVSASTATTPMARASLRILRSRRSRALRVELLGVLEAHAGEDADLLREDDGGGDDGAEERAAADLVDAGDGAEAVVAQGLLGRVGADELLEHLLLGGGFGDALNFGDAEERRHRLNGFKCSGRGAEESVPRVADRDEVSTGHDTSVESVLP